MFPNLEKRFSQNLVNVSSIFFPFGLFTIDGYMVLPHGTRHHSFLCWGAGCTKVVSKYNSNTILNFLR